MGNDHDVSLVLLLMDKLFLLYDSLFVYLFTKVSV